ncbi:hypothetical protein [uncultured Dokdonia sp.]|uniref:hypothetical protein n=1 Tax=uncultured Dokdonia sp. TaxID=575653 RepID=UPI00261FA815|nr:hypothetical protein [uncultured Dokdonia sp.]
MRTAERKPELKYISGKITYRLLRDIILDERLTNEDTIILNPSCFDDVILEYRDTYGESMTFPHLLLGVLIREKDDERIPIRRIGILRNDDISDRNIEINTFNYYDGEIVYRCGWCGSIVDKNGIVLNGYDRERSINYIQNYKNSIVHNVPGNCCPNGHD